MPKSGTEKVTTVSRRLAAAAAASASVNISFRISQLRFSFYDALSNQWQ